MPSDPLLAGATAGIILDDLRYAVSRATHSDGHVHMTVTEMKAYARDNRLSIDELRELGVALSVRVGRMKRWQAAGPLDLMPKVQYPLWIENVELDLAGGAEFEMEYQAKLRLDKIDSEVPRSFQRPLLLSRLLKGETQSQSQTVIAELSRSVTDIYDTFCDDPKFRELDQDPFGELTPMTIVALDEVCNQMARDFMDHRTAASDALDALGLDHGYEYNAHEYPFEFN